VIDQTQPGATWGLGDVFLQPRQVADLAYRHGVTNAADLAVIIAICYAESQAGVNAWHDNLAADGVTVLSRDVGLFQINIPASAIGGPQEEALYDPEKNAAAMFALYSHRRDEPWASFNCVPLDAQILTRRGWLDSTDVRAGFDQTLGYDTALEQLRWTSILHVGQLEKQVTIEIDGRQWKARVTPGHRWSLVRNWYTRRTRTPREELAPTNEIRPHDRIRLAAVAVGGDLPISPQEAAVIAWLLGDGSMRTRQSDGRRRAFMVESDEADLVGKACILQSKPSGVAALQALLEPVPHRATQTAHIAEGQNYRRSRFTLAPDYVRDVLARAEIDQRGLMGFVFGLSMEARQAFVEAFVMAEGGHEPTGSYFTQNEGATT